MYLSIEEIRMHALSSAADRTYMKAPVPSLWDKMSQTSGHRDYMCGHTHLF